MHFSPEKCGGGPLALTLPPFLRVSGTLRKEPPFFKPTHQQPQQSVWHTNKITKPPALNSTSPSSLNSDSPRSTKPLASKQEPKPLRPLSSPSRPRMSCIPT